MSTGSRNSALYCYLLIFGMLGVLFCSVPQTTHAQTLFTNGATLVSNPRFPTPYTETTVSLDDYSLNTAGAEITWTIDGVEQKESKNARAVTFVTGALGKKQVVKATLRHPNMAPLTASLTITPAEVHVILEANTSVPAFYKGRALPAAESAVRAVALVYDGTNAAPTAYTYRWSLDGTVMLGGPIKGKNDISFTLPLFGEKYLSVEALNAEGAMVGKGYILLRAAEPELHFYEENPLRGLSQRAMQNQYAFIGDEVTIHGEPYFMRTDGVQNATHGWTVGGTKASSNTNKPNALRLERVGETGSVAVSLEIVSRMGKIPQFVRETINLVF